MLRTIPVILSLVLAVAACGKKKPPAAPATDDTAASDSDTAGPEEGERTEVATGEMREILLALQRVHFALDSDDLTPQSRTALTEAGEKLAKYTDVHLSVDGHADQRGTSEYNVALGERRARIVSDFLKRLGVAEDRLSIMSYGEEQPLIEGEDRRAMAANRRVEFKLKRGNVRLVLEEGDMVDDKGNPLADGEEGGAEGGEEGGVEGGTE
jgi:peptidoglycan-associated lipoprotein